MYFIFLLELFILFFSSKYLIKYLSLTFFKITRSKRAVVAGLSLLFFPGVVIHELSHMLMAGILFVKVHDLNLTPKIDEEHVQLGNVQISKTDPFRRLLIGLAPVLVGGVLLGLLSWYVLKDISIEHVFNSWVSIFKYVVFLYGFFVIANTMFSSRKDVEGGIVLLIIIVVILASLQIGGVPLDEYAISVLKTSLLIEFAKMVVLLLSIPVAVNLICLGLLKLINKNVS